MKRKNLNLLLVFALIATMLVGCGDSAKTGVVNEIGAVEAPMAEKEAVDEPSEVIEEVAEESEVASTETTEVSTPEPIEEVTPEPTEEPEPTPTPEPTKEPEPTPAPEPVHEHSYSSTIIKEGTCSTPGTKLYTCSCGHSYEKEYVSECIGDGNRVIVKQPTCTSVGVTAEHCIYCGWEMYGESIPAIAHTPKSYWVYFPQSGTYVHECAICNSVITSTTTRPEGVEIREATPVQF